MPDQTEVITENGQRHYIRNGVSYPSVTTITGAVLRKPWLERWRGEVGNAMADRRRDAGGEHGKKLHRQCVLIAAKAKIIPFELTELESQQLDAFSRWLDMAVGEVLDYETAIFNDRYQYAGRYDFRAILKGDRLPAMVDIKTGIYDEISCRTQTAAYKNGDGVVCDRRIIVDLKNIKANGMPTIHDLDNYQADLNAFLYCRSLYGWMKGIK